MKLGQVLKKEREKKKLSLEDVAEKLAIKVKEYEELESGESPAEIWGPRLALIAIKTGRPTSRHLAKSGKFKDCNQEKGQAGKLIKKNREERDEDEQVTISDIAKYLGIPEKEYLDIEAGKSPIEKYGPLLLGFAQVIDQPVFNLFYPCGVPLDKLDDYP